VLPTCTGARLEGWAAIRAREAARRRLEQAIVRDRPHFVLSAAAAPHLSFGRKTSAVTVDIVLARINDHRDGTRA